MAKMNFASEKDMVDVYLEINNEEDNPFYREVAIGGYGRADLLRIESPGDYCILSVLEFKNRFLEVSDLLQIIRYKKGLMQYFEQYLPKVNLQVCMQIVCTGLHNSNDVCYLTDTISGLEIVVADISVNGVSFHTCAGYFLKNPNFNEIKIFTDMWDNVGHVPQPPDISASASVSDSVISKISF